MKNTLTFALIFAFAAPAFAKDKPRWRKVDLNAEAPFEAAGAADLDGDGKLDVFSGDSWYQAPRWVRHKVRDVPPSNAHYHEDFGDMPLDVNGDGKPDMVTCSYFGKLIGWIEHPGNPLDPWPLHEVERPGASEACRLVDINGDGKVDLLPNTNNMIVWYELAAQKPEVKWVKHEVTKEGAGHGVGEGDINGDGRLDLIGPHGWYEQPADPAQPWTFHREFELGPAGMLILGRDVDGDGLTDVVWGMGHNYGLLWLKQGKGEGGQRSWTRQEIDMTLAEVHTLHWADIDGNGHPALITGRRIYAHEVEPGATDAPVVAAYRFDRKQGKWQKEVIFQGEAPKNPPEKGADRQALKDFPRGSVGTGLHIEVVDIDRDGDLDLICPGKSGLYLLENLRRSPRQSPARKVAVKP